jgi:probable rRNA maturation factor
MTEPPTVQVDDEGFPDAPVALIARAVRLTLARERRPEVEMSVALLGDEEMRRLNREYLGKDHTTDVLAFALADEVGATVGDIYLGHDQAARQADEVGVSLSEELARLAIHGALHVLGHDHPEGPDRADSDMFRLQESLLQQLMGAVEGS